MTTRRLLYITDPMCSWCWGFSPVVDALAKRAAVDGVPLHLIAGGLRVGSIEPLDTATRQTILGHWRAVGEKTAQPFHFDNAMPPDFIYDTEPACRALVTARNLDPAHAWPLVKAMQHAFYAEGRDISRTEVLAALAEKNGFDPQRFTAYFESMEARKETHADFEQARALHVTGFPTVLLERDGHLKLFTHGYQPLAQLEPLLSDWLNSP